MFLFLQSDVIEFYALKVAQIDIIYPWIINRSLLYIFEL